jgi:hypothetical protein
MPCAGPVDFGSSGLKISSKGDRTKLLPNFLLLRTEYSIPGPHVKKQNPALWAQETFAVSEKAYESQTGPHN